MQGIEMLEDNMWSHREDLDENFIVGDSTLEEIRALAASGASADDVADQIQKKTRICSELIKYIAKTKITDSARTPVRLLFIYFPSQVYFDCQRRLWDIAHITMKNS